MSPWRSPTHRIRKTIASRGAPIRRHSKKIGAWVNCPAVDFVCVLLLCQCERVSKCTGVRFSVDHVLPLGAGGKHAAGNMQILPRSLNLAKGKNTAFRLPEPYRNPQP